MWFEIVPEVWSEIILVAQEQSQIHKQADQEQRAYYDDLPWNAAADYLKSAHGVCCGGTFGGSFCQG